MAVVLVIMEEVVFILMIMLQEMVVLHYLDHLQVPHMLLQVVVVEVLRVLMDLTQIVKQMEQVLVVGELHHLLVLSARDIKVK